MRIELSVKLSIGEIAKAVGGYCNEEIVCKYISHITTSTKDAMEGDLFIALKGKRFDGEDFTQEASNLGCFLLSTKPLYNSICVDSSSSALLKLANYYKREKLTKLKHTVAITGSVGKTTTKELMKAICGKIGTTHATAGNLNNLIGLPLTVLSAGANTEILILELGMNHLGEIRLLSECAEPTLGIITNVGTSHIGLLGSREMIARAKSEITFGMKEDSYVIIPYGEALLDGINNKITYSTNSENADFYMKIIKSGPEYAEFNVNFSGQLLEGLKASVGGEHNLSNLSCAIAGAMMIGTSEKDIKGGLKGLSTSCTRCLVKRCGDFVVYDDAYNSSLESITASIKHIKSFFEPFSIVLGDILELGDKSEQIHSKVGYAAGESGCKRLFAIGKFAPYIRAGAIAAGLIPENILVYECYDELKDVANDIRQRCSKDEMILIKASNRLKLSRLCELLEKKES